MAFKIAKSAMASLSEVKVASTRATKSLESAVKEEQNLINFVCKPKKAEITTWLKDDDTLAASIDTTAISLDGKIKKEITFHVIDSELTAMISKAKKPLVISAAFGKSEVNKNRLYAVRAEEVRDDDEDVEE